MEFDIRDGVYDKSNRVYDSNGIAPTLTCANAENERYKVYEDDMREIIRVGQVSNEGSQSGCVYSTEGLFPCVMVCTHGYAMGNIKEDYDVNKLIRLGNVYPSGGQAGEIYDSNGICPTIVTFTGGGGKQPMCLEIKNEIKGESENMRGLRELKKYNFNMETIRMFDVFAGVGALHQGHDYLGVPTEIIAMSEIEVDAIISYAGVHIDNFKNLEFEYPSEDEMRQLLIDRNIGYSYEKGKSSIPRLKKDKLYNVYKATILLNNLGDISKINYDEIPDFDFMNFSFSCTDLSNAGKQKGMRNEDGTPTRSGLYVYGIKAIRSKKPKYVMIENVKGLIQKKFIDDFYSIIEELEEIGYNCYYPTKEDKKGNKTPVCLNTKNFAVPQNRERIFVYCIRKDLDDNQFEFNYGFESDIRLKDILEDNVDEKYYLSEEIQKRFKPNGKFDEDRNELNVVGSSAPECRTIGQRDITYGTNGIMSTLTATDYKQPKQILDNNIHVVGSTLAEGETKFAVMNRVYDDRGIAPTLDTMQGGNRQPKIVDDNFFVDKKGRTQKFEEKENYIQWDTSGKGYNSQVDRAFYEDGNVGTIPAMNPQDKTQVIESVKDECTVCEQRSDEGLRFFKDNICGSLRTIDACGDKRIIEYKPKYRIRKLTPKECWLLQGFRSDLFERAKALGISDSSLYKQAGNSITVDVIYWNLLNLYKKYIVE